MNRILLGVERMRVQVAKRLSDGLTTQEQVDKCCQDLDMGLDEYCKLQEMKSIACMDGTLTLDEANTVYGYLGETLEHFNSQPVEVKAVCTKLCAELLSRRIAALA